MADPLVWTAAGAALVGGTLVARQWLHTRPLRWAATWHEEARALGMRAVESADGPPLLEGTLDGREARISAVRQTSGAWRVRVELRIASADGAPVDPLRRALATLAGDGHGGNLALEEHGRHDRPGELRRLTQRALEGARALERLD